jgi:hypothetical protein
MATQSGESRPTIVLVHGAWADATGFDAEIRALQRASMAISVTEYVDHAEALEAVGLRE